MLMSQKLLLNPYVFPVIEPFPDSATVDTANPVVTISGANYKIGTIEESGWYFVCTKAAMGDYGYHGHVPGSAFSVYYPVYFYSGTKYIIWSASGQITGYPWKTGTGANSEAGAYGGVLGGGGGTGTGRSGGGGGGPGGNGGNGGYNSGSGGGGGGFIAGLNLYQPTLTESWSHGDFSVDTVECMLLAGGGGGGAGNEGSNRSGGGGGGAWGNGGAGYIYAGGSGPGGGSFGVGGSGAHYGNGGDGAWCIRDYTTNCFKAGNRPSLAGLNFGNNLKITNLSSAIYTLGIFKVI